MDQVHLLACILNMKIGEEIRIAKQGYIEAVRGELQGLDRLAPVREEDIKAFFDKISVNWDVDVFYNTLFGDVTLRKRR